MYEWVRNKLNTYSCLLIFMPTMLWADSTPWPEPLSLEFSLSQASANHPQLQMAAAELERAKAVQSQVRADTGFEVALSARLRWIEPQRLNIDQSSEDHRLSLSVSKPLYDFGRSAAKEMASDADMQGRAFEYQNTLSRHRIAIMAAFFDVLLADQAYARDTEDMSMTYVRFDRARSRNELGQLSDIDLMQKRSRYQASRLRQARSIALQRTTRAHLADMLNRPNQLPSELLEPQLDFSSREIPEEVEVWLEEMEQGNALLLSLKAQQSSAKAQLELAQVDDNPQLNGRAEISEYSRNLGVNDVWRAGVNLYVPIFTGGRSGALQAKQRAELQKAIANVEYQLRILRQQLLETWAELQTLKITQQRLTAEREYRDLYLDRSRAKYELEVSADFGDAMVFMSALRYRIMRMNFSTALAWAQVDAMMGHEQTSSFLSSGKLPGNKNKGEGK